MTAISNRVRNPLRSDLDANLNSINNILDLNVEGVIYQNGVTLESGLSNPMTETLDMDGNDITNIGDLIWDGNDDALILFQTNTNSSGASVAFDNINTSDLVTADSGIIITTANNIGDPFISFDTPGVGNEFIIGVDNTDSSNFKIANSATLDTNTRLTIDQSGLVGIGTDAPTELLHLASIGSAKILLEADTDNLDETHVPGVFFSWDNGQSKAECQATGNGGIYENDLGNAFAFNAGVTGALGKVQFGTNKIIHMTIDRFGDTGFGTNTPTEKLDVVGNINITGDYLKGGVEYLERAGTTSIQISSAAEFDALSVTDTITISTDTTLVVKTSFTTAKKIVVNSGISFLINSSTIHNTITYTGGATFLTTDGASVIAAVNTNFHGSFTGTFYDTVNTGFFLGLEFASLIGWLSFGTVKDADFFSIDSVTGFSNNNQLVLDNIKHARLDTFTINNTLGTSSPVKFTQTDASELNILSILSNNIQLGVSAPGFIEIDSVNIHSDTVISINGSLMSGSNQVLFDTSGLDEKALQVLAFNNIGQKDSKYLGNYFFDGSVLQENISSGVFTTCDLTGLTVGPTTERFDIGTTGLLTYTGRELFEGSVFINISAVKGGGTQNYKFGVLINGLEITPYVPLEVKDTQLTVLFVTPVSLTQNDTIELAIEGVAHSEDITLDVVSFCIL
jgi:hypothetical protein